MMCGMKRGMKDRLQDLDFADDIYLQLKDLKDMELKWLNINVNKTKEMKLNAMIEEKLSIYDKEDVYIPRKQCH